MPFPSAFCVFQGAILTTMLATRNFSGRCCLRGSSPRLAGCPGQTPRVPGELSSSPSLTGDRRLHSGASGAAWHWAVIWARSPGTSRLAAGLVCKRKCVWLRHSGPQRFRFLGFVCTHPSGSCWGGDVGTRASQGSRQLVLCPPGDVCGSGRASSALGKCQKGPRVLPQPDGSGISWVPPALPDFTGRDQRVTVIPRHCTKKEPGDCRSRLLAVTSSPPQHWGWPWQRWDRVSQPGTLAGWAGGSCLVLDGCFGVVCDSAPGAGCSGWAGGEMGAAGPAGCRGRGPWYLHLSC